MNNISTYNQAEAAYRRIKEKNARLKEKVMQQRDVLEDLE
jgi:hypothetical protein